MVNNIASTTSNILNTAFTAGTDLIAAIPGGKTVISTLSTIISDAIGTYNLVNAIRNDNFNVSQIANTISFSLNPIVNTITNAAASLIGSVFGKSVGNFAGTFMNIASTVISFMGGCPFWICPIVLDITGNGINTTALTNSKTYFDMEGDGLPEKTGWIGAGNGFLVQNNNRKVTSINQMFGSNNASNGFSQLSAFDSNHDGIINASDANFSKLAVWQDANGNGVVDSGELQTLTQLGIKSINLNATNVQVQNNGNYVTQISSYTKIDGKQYLAADVNFAVNKTDTYNPAAYKLVAGEVTLPWLRGYGTLVDLPQAMATNADLLNYVYSFKNKF